jgi:hypothetical protein
MLAADGHFCRALPFDAWQNRSSGNGLPMNGVGGGLSIACEPTVHHRGFAELRCAYSSPTPDGQAYEPVLVRHRSRVS